MKIVIDIPEENYQIALTKLMLEFKGCSITTLPKGHGRLIDADAMINAFVYTATVYDAYGLNEMLEEMPTIIEADKGDK